MLIFDPTPNGLSWFFQDGTNGSHQSGSFLPSSEEFVFPPDVEECLRRTEIVACVIPDGGGFISAPATTLTPDLLPKLASVSGGKAVASIFDRVQQIIPHAACYLLCETALFDHLPERARFYALPQPWRTAFPRRGANGLAHAWAYAAAGKPRCLVSVHLCDRPSAAALKDGRAVETSAGFSPIDGLPGLTSAGAVDPSLTLELLREGRTPAEVRDLLENQSGFQVFDPEAHDLADLIAKGGLPVEMLVDGLLKAVGVCLAALGGADIITVSTEEPERWLPVTGALRARLSFLQTVPNPPHYELFAAPRALILIDALRSFGS